MARMTSTHPPDDGEQPAEDDRDPPGPPATQPQAHGDGAHGDYGGGGISELGEVGAF